MRMNTTTIMMTAAAAMTRNRSTAITTLTIAAAVIITSTSTIITMMTIAAAAMTTATAITTTDKNQKKQCRCAPLLRRAVLFYQAKVCRGFIYIGCTDSPSLRKVKAGNIGEAPPITDSRKGCPCKVLYLEIVQSRGENNISLANLPQRKKPTRVSPGRFSLYNTLLIFIRIKDESKLR